MRETKKTAKVWPAYLKAVSGSYGSHDLNIIYLKIIAPRQ